MFIARMSKSGALYQGSASDSNIEMTKTLGLIMHSSNVLSAARAGSARKILALARLVQAAAHMAMPLGRMERMVGGRE